MKISRNWTIFFWVLVILVSFLYAARNTYAWAERTLFPPIRNVNQGLFYFNEADQTYTFEPQSFKLRTSCNLQRLYALNHPYYDSGPSTVLPWWLYEGYTPYEEITDSQLQEFDKIPEIDSHPRIHDKILKVRLDDQSLIQEGFFLLFEYKCPLYWLTGYSYAEVGPLPIRTFTEDDARRLREVGNIKED